MNLAHYMARFLGTITQQNFGNGPASTSSNTAATTSSNSGNIQVYIVGAVLRPGVYTLAAGARVYALLQAAGGPLPKANLVALNLAAKLTDGEEVYVTMIGEIPPTYLGRVPGPGNGTPNNAATGQLVTLPLGLEAQRFLVPFPRRATQMEARLPPVGRAMRPTTGEQYDPQILLYVD